MGLLAVSHQKVWRWHQNSEGKYGEFNQEYCKKILEQPEELREEIQGVERIEKYIDEFIGLDEENKDRKIKKFDVLKSITREKEFSNMVFGLIEVKKTPEAFAELLEEEMPEKELPHLKEAALNGYPLFFSGMQWAHPFLLMSSMEEKTTASS